MLGKIPPFVLLIVGPLLVAGVIAGAYIYMFMPKQKEIAQVTADAIAQEQKADTLSQEEAKLDLAKDEWVIAHEGLAQKMDERSIPISMAHPTTAMISLWKEVREDLPLLVEKFIKESGCIIIKGHPGWTAPTTPYPPTSTWIEAPLGQQASGSHPILQPSSQSVENWNSLAPRVEFSGSSSLATQKQSDQRYMALASRAVNANLPASIQVAGKIENIERLYKSLRNFPRIMTIQHLILTKLDSQFLGDDVNWISERLDADPDELVLADIAMTIWILCEAPEAAPAAAAGGGMGGAMGGMPGASGGAMGGMPGMSGGAAPGGMMPGPGGASGGGPGASSSSAGASKGSSAGSKSSSEAE